jgi:phage tail-like protein
MDANLQRPYQVADDVQWAKLGVPPLVEYDRRRRVLRLSNSRREPAWVEDEDLARSFLEWVPGSIDRFGTRARWDAVSRAVVATGAFADEIPIYTPPPLVTVQDVAIGHDDVLYVAVGGRVALVDLRARWSPVEIGMAPEFRAWRLAPTPEGGAYCLDRVSHGVARVRGLPMRPRRGVYSPATFRPSVEDADPPRGLRLDRAQWPHDAEREVAIACSPEGRLALLTWDLQGGDARVRVLGSDERFGPATVLIGVRRPYSLAWVGADRIAVLIAAAEGGQSAEAPVYPVIPGAPATSSVGDLFPLREQRAGTPFLHGVEERPHYQTSSGAGARPLQQISLPSFADEGVATNARAIDSGEQNTIWHRVYLEASIPPGCGVAVWLATSEAFNPPPDDGIWHEHRFGAVPGEASVDVPQGVWLREPSELPFSPGLLPCAQRPHRSGLWTALIQRPRFRVRTLAGRFIWVRVVLHGDGRSTPEVAALRVYGGRRSYITSYLPELYHETVFAPDADVHSEPGGPRVSSTPADFLERLVGTFESVLTPIEDRIAQSWLLTDPAAAPEGALEWLASWVGFSFAPVLPADRRRRMLERAMELYARRGTLKGLALALDLATGGAVERQQIVVLEDFRLRRTFATILGADLAPEDDPLLPGLLVSGNSFVGDTLFLGDESNAEFLAVFSADLEVDHREARAIADLFDRLAHRATVLVHEELEEQDLGLIRQIVEREAPAHVSVQVLTATHRFLVGMSSLIGIDTYLARKPSPRPVQTDVSQLGMRDVIQHLPSLDPRLGGARSTPPEARAASPGQVAAGSSFELDGRASRATPGHRIVRYHWTRLD